ncbi:RcnB family protein [Novosphingobium tardum]|uniref:RcnB family protein n=1 Tax=Novosphingobium tardum TaxID=1538021 RepID=A0ABV8RSS5_9SPHN
MARFTLLQTAALAAMVATATSIAPAQAQDADGQGNQARMERRADARAERQEARQQQRAESGGGWQGRQRQEAPAVAAPQQRAAQGGWGSQRPSEGTRYGRDWSNGGAVNRPAPAVRAADPAVPQRRYDRNRRGAYGQIEGSGQVERNRTYDRQRSGAYGQIEGRTQVERNRTYSDPNRDRSYGGRDGYRDRDGSQYRNDQYRSGSQYRDGDRYRDGTRYSRDGHRQWNSDWRRDSRYNWSSYRNSNRNVYRLGRYYSPYRNYSYSRVNIGFFLDNLFYSNRYWINDPWQYRLPEVYGPYRWVRYYDDVLLVDIYSGEVVDVIRDFFW